MDATEIIANAFQQLIDKLDQVNHKIENTPNQFLSDTWLDVEETMKLLKVSRSTLQNYRDKGMISFSQVGNKIYFRRSDLDDLRESHYVKAFNQKR
jgi:excisionase family DNA binding protein